MPAGDRCARVAGRDAARTRCLARRRAIPLQAGSPKDRSETGSGSLLAIAAGSDRTQGTLPTPCGVPPSPGPRTPTPSSPRPPTQPPQDTNDVRYGALEHLPKGLLVG